MGQGGSEGRVCLDVVSGVAAVDVQVWGFEVSICVVEALSEEERHSGSSA